MEGDEYHRRQYEQHSNFAQGRGYASNPRSMPGGVSDRIRPSQQLSSMRSPTSASRVAAAGATTPTLTGYAFPHSQQYTTTSGQETSLQYQPELGQDPQRQQHSHFSQYPQNMLYNVQQQAQSQSPYDSVQPYQPRQSAAIEVLSNQFGVSPYYSSAESASVAGSAPVAQQYAGNQYSQYQQTSSVARIAIPSSYSGVLPDYSQSAVPGRLESQEETRGNDHDAAYNRYFENLGRIFQNVRDGRLAEAAQSLLDVSGWLLGSAVQLGTNRTSL